METATSESSRALRVTKLRRDRDGYWVANVSDGTTTRSFHDRYGSWQTDRRRRADAHWREGVTQADAPGPVARALSERVRRLERREQRQPSANKEATHA